MSAAATPRATRSSGCREEQRLFAGDMVEYGATPYCGDAHFTDWPDDAAAAARRWARRSWCPAAAEPDRREGGRGGHRRHARLPRATSSTSAKARRAKAATLKQAYDKAMAAMQPQATGNWVIFEHCMPFNVSRAYDEAKGLDHPRIWTAERDIEMWKALEHGAAVKSGRDPRCC